MGFDIRFRLTFLLALGFALFPRAAAAAVEGRPCTPEPTDMTIAYGDVITCQIDVVGDTDVFRFSGVAGETVGINVTHQAGAGQPCLSVRDSSGASVGGSCYYGTAGATIRLARTGTFTIQVSDWGSDQTLSYALSLDRITPRSPTARLIRYGQNLSDEINPIGDVDEFFFGAAVGGTVTITVTSLGAGQPCVAVYDPQATVAGSSCYYGSTSTTFKVTHDGIHTIAISEWGMDSTLPYRVDVQCAGVCPLPASYDFDGNGFPDVIWQDPVTGESQLWALAFGQGASVIGGVAITSGNPWRIAAVADVNGDGHPDVIWQDPNTGQSQVWLLGGAQGTTVTGAANISFSNPWRIVAAGDFDNDGHVDLVWQDPNSGQAQIWYLGGTQGTTVVNAANVTAGNSWRIAGAGDFNGDGRLDLLWQDPASGAAQVWFLGGALGNVVTGAANLSSANSWRIAAVADFDNDGHPDVVWQNPANGISAVWLLGGAQGTTATGSVSLSGPNSWRIVGPR